MKILAEFFHKFYTGQVPYKPNFVLNEVFFLSLGVYECSTASLKTILIEQFQGDVKMDQKYRFG